MMPANKEPMERSNTGHSGEYGIVSGAFAQGIAKLGSQPECLIGQVSTANARLSSVA